MRHTLWSAWSAMLLVGAVGFSFCLAQEDKKERSRDTSPAQANQAAADLDAIRAESQAFVTAFNKHDAKAIAALWTQDCDYIDDSGRRFAGRDAIETAYAQFFAENPNAKMRIVIDSLRLLSGSTAIEDGQAVVDSVPGDAPAIGKYTAVHVKVDGKWLMSAVRDSRVETPSNYRHVADLEWLIGTWTAEDYGVKTVSVCRWIANKSFVERAYTVTHPDHTTASGVQIIGFNPAAGHVQSWSFTSDGGHAVGIWMPRENGWQAEVQGVASDGTITSAINLLTRIDDNAYAWQSVQRTAGGVSLPDTDEVVIKRQSGAP